MPVARLMRYWFHLSWLGFIHLMVLFNLPISFACTNTAIQRQNDHYPLTQFHNRNIVWKNGSPYSQKYSKKCITKPIKRIPQELEFLVSPFILSLSLLWMTVMQHILTRKQRCICFYELVSVCIWINGCISLQSIL